MYTVDARPNVSHKVVRHSLAYLSAQKWFAGDVPYYVKIWPKTDQPLQKRRFPINIRSQRLNRNT